MRVRAHLSPIVAGIFIGGRSSRMGGIPKGLLPSPSGEPIVTRLVSMLRDLGAEVVLVGQNDAYAEVGVPQIADAAGVEGPLAGLVALLERSQTAITVACDMPFVSPSLLTKLIGAPPAAICAPRIEGRWEPFFARYDSARVLPVARDHAARRELALQRLFDACAAVALDLPQELERELADWDRPEDRLVPG